MMARRDQQAELIELIGEDATIALVEAFGGTRLLVPTRLPDTHPIVEAIGREHALSLSDRLAPDVIRVPLARELRARHYRERLRLSNARIASRLGMTETGVEKLFKRIGSDEPAPSALPLFPEG